MKNKIFIYITVTLLVLGLVLPSISSNAAQSSTMTVGEMMTIDYFPMTRANYTEGAQDDYERNSNYNQSLCDEDLSNWFDIPDDITAPNGYYKIKDISITLGGVAGVPYDYKGMIITYSAFRYYLYVIQTVDSVNEDYTYYFNGFYSSSISGYYSAGSAVISSNNIYITRYPISKIVDNGYTFVQLGSGVNIATGDTIQFLCDQGRDHGWVTLNSNGQIWENVSNVIAGCTCYSTLPLYMGFSQNTVGGDVTGYNQCNYPINFINDKFNVGYQYSDLSSNTNNGCNLASEFFLKDRREVFPNNTLHPVVTPDNDTPSQEYYGAWDIDLAPVGDVLSGNMNVKFVPSNRLANYDGDFDIHYTFQLQFIGQTIPAQGVLARRYEIALANRDNLSDFNGVNYSFVKNADFTVNSGSFQDNLTNEYIPFRTIDILHSMEETGNYCTSKSTGRLNNFDAYCVLGAYRDVDLFSDTTLSGSASVSFGAVTAGISSAQGNVKLLLMTVYAQAYYNGDEFTDIASASYNYFTGDVIKQGTTSTVNNNYSPENVPDNITPNDYENNYNKTLQHIYEDGGVKNVTGGNITGGNTSSTSSGGSVVNNNQDSIDIKSNWQYFLETNPDDNNPDDNVSAVDQFREAYEIVTTPENNPINSDVVQFLFTSDLWSIYPFNLILGFSGMLVTVGIFTAILRLFRR